MDREKMIAAGVDYDEGVERFDGQPKLFEKYLAKFLNGPLMGTLEKQLAENDIAGAFRTAHDLKGAAGNLSLNTYYEKICVLTEILRGGNEESDYAAALSEAKALYDAAAAAAREE